MRKIVYYVAMSLDGFISGSNDNISGFVSEGNGVTKYRSDLASFDTVIMGRNTYEFGYKYGLQPGQAPYAGLKHYIFSNTLSFEKQSDDVSVKKMELSEISKLKQQPGSDIYLCGGGQFAGWLLDHQQIDVLKIKLSPFIQGEGVRLFGGSKKEFKMELQETATYDHGLQIMTFRMRY